MAEGWPGWPSAEEELVAAQRRLAAANRQAEPWSLAADEAELWVGGCFVAYARGQAGPGAPGDQAWAAAVVWRAVMAPSRSRVARRSDRALAGTGPGLPRRASDIVEQGLVVGTVPASYKAGLLALREGPLLEAAMRALRAKPSVLLVDATGADHPRRAGLAVHLGAVLGVPTVGVTHRPLLGTGNGPGLERGATSPVSVDGEVVGYWVTTRSRARPVVAHAAWRTSPGTAAGIVLACSSEGARTPVPLAEARRVAREARALAEGRVRADLYRAEGINLDRSL